MATVEQIVCWSTYSTTAQYTLHLRGVSRGEIAKFGSPLSEIRQLYDTESKLCLKFKNYSSMFSHAGRRSFEGIQRKSYNPGLACSIINEQGRVEGGLIFERQFHTCV